MDIKHLRKEGHSIKAITRLTGHSRNTVRRVLRQKTRLPFHLTIVVGPGSVTTLGDVDVQVMYGHIALRILDHQHKPLLTQPNQWSPVWISEIRMAPQFMNLVCHLQILSNQSI